MKIAEEELTKKRNGKACLPFLPREGSQVTRALIQNSFVSFRFTASAIRALLVSK